MIPKQSVKEGFYEACRPHHYDHPDEERRDVGLCSLMEILINNQCNSHQDDQIMTNVIPIMTTKQQERDKLSPPPFFRAIQQKWERTHSSSAGLRGCAAIIILASIGGKHVWKYNIKASISWLVSDLDGSNGRPPCS